MMAFLTVFTPTYNRAHTLSRTYQSLCRQECKDFVWLVVDDGSTDGTADLVRSWQQEANGFEIRYLCSSSILAGERHFVREAPHKFLTLLCVPAGFLLAVITKRKANV